MYARIKPHSPRHGRTTRRYTLGGKLFIEGYSSPQHQKTLWYQVADKLADLLKLQRNEVGKLIFDVVTEEQARAIDIQEGNPFAGQSAVAVADGDLYQRAYSAVQERNSVADVPLWRYDPDSEYVPDLPPGYLEGKAVAETAPPAGPSRASTKLSKPKAAGAAGGDDAAWEQVEAEQRTRTPRAASREELEATEAATAEKNESGADPDSAEGTPAPARPRRRGDAI